MALTLKRVARLVNAGERGRHLDERNLYLVVKSAANCSWLLRYEINGTKRWMGLGSVADFSLDEARDRARKARQLLADGIDPLAMRRAEADRRAQAEARDKTFAVTGEEYFTTHEATWGPAYRRATRNMLAQFAYPTLGNRAVSAIDQPLVLSVLRPIWNVKTKTATRLRQRIEAILDYATVAKYRHGDNPAVWDGRLEHLLPAPGKIVKEQNFEALPYAEVGEFLRRLRELPGFPARALEICILTATRREEVAGATWSEIDTNGVWSIPAGRMKSDRDFRVPLSRQAVRLLSDLPRERGSDWIFPSTRAGKAIIGNSMLTVLRTLHPTITVHGFRSSFRDWAGERSSASPDVIELSLAHAVGSDVERRYRRSDLIERRRQLMQSWADFLDQPQRGAAVTPIRSRK